jgi:hypothetical protein
MEVGHPIDGTVGHYMLKIEWVRTPRGISYALCSVALCRLCQRGLRLGQPEGHLHRLEELDGNG